MNETNTLVVGQIRKTFAKEMNLVIDSFEDLSAETRRLKNERDDLIVKKKVDKTVSIVNVLTLIALYEITKKAFNKWIW